LHRLAPKKAQIKSRKITDNRDKKKSLRRGFAVGVGQRVRAVVAHGDHELVERHGRIDGDLASEELRVEPQ
jgi:hypothetical protein